MLDDSSTTDELLRLAGQADRSALGRLLERHRLRLRRMVAARLDPRITARVDPSDIVQESLADTARWLPTFLRDRPVPYWVWLKRHAVQRVIWWRRFHLGSRKRSVARERAFDRSTSDRPTLAVVDQLIASGTSPSGHAVCEQEREWVQNAMESLAATDRRVLELRYIESLSFAEIAAKLDLGLSAVKMRHLRALRRLRELSEGPIEEKGA
jgi:RNA polymerase sigma-70 factor (ECF subfamily)